MPNKAQEYVELADVTARKLAGDYRGWDMYSGYTGQKLDEPVPSSAVDFYTKFGLRGMYEPKTEKELVEPAHKKKRHEPER